MADWKRAEETELVQYFEGPPPLTGEAVSNTIVWILAFAPIIGENIESFLVSAFNTRDGLNNSLRNEVAAR